VAWPVPVFALGPAGVSPARAEEPGRRRARRGLSSREPSPPVHHPLMERRLCIFEMDEAADRVALALTAGSRPSPPGVRGHEGEARHQPQGCQE
jgi:hypothetical protein